MLVQDADLEYDPLDWSRLLEPILRRKAQVVYGSRFTGERKNMLPLHWIGNRFLSLVTNLLYSSTLSDMETCYKMFDRRVLEGITIESDRFDFEPEITAKVLRRGYRIYEVPISYAGREPDEGKKITWRDGFGALKALIKYRFTRLGSVTGGAEGRTAPAEGPDRGGPVPGTVVVIVNYESGDALLRCVEGLAIRRRLRVVVVDNGSGDGSVERVRSRHPDARGRRPRGRTWATAPPPTAGWPPPTNP